MQKGKNQKRLEHRVLKGRFGTQSKNGSLVDLPIPRLKTNFWPHVCIFSENAVWPIFAHPSGGSNWLVHHQHYPHSRTGPQEGAEIHQVSAPKKNQAMLVLSPWFCNQHHQIPKLQDQVTPLVNQAIWKWFQGKIHLLKEPLTFHGNIDHGLSAPC